MKLLLTNDDGYEADGLQELAKSLSRDHEIWIVAPDSCRSCCSHGVTNASPIELTKVADRGWRVGGTPADCVRIAKYVLQLEPDFVLSGVNHGGNLGIDTLFSGTVAAAREATLLGYSSASLSQYMRRDISKDWVQSAHRAKRVLETVWNRTLEPGRFWNINLPAMEPVPDVELAEFPISFCELEPEPLAFDYQIAEPKDESAPPINTTIFHYISNYQTRPRGPGSDVSLCFSGHATVTPLRAFP